MRGTVSAPISANTLSVTSNCDSYPGSPASITCNNSDALRASSNVDLKEATKSWGKFLINPTVSLTNILGTLSGCKVRTLVSSVANNLLATNTSLPVNARIKVDLPAFV